MKRFFIYELKKSLFVMGVLTVIAAAVYVVTLLSSEGWMFREYTPFPLEAIFIPAGAMCVIVPIWKLSYRMKKRSVDLYYSLPLSHTRILAVKLLVGLIVVFASYTAAYWIGSFTSMGAIAAYWKGSDIATGMFDGVVEKTLNGVMFLPLYFSTIIPMLIIYVLTAFIFTRANRFIDGVVFIALTGLSLAMVAEFISVFTVEGSVYINTIFYTPAGALALVWNYFSDSLFEGASIDMMIEAQDIVGLVLVAACAVAAGVGLFVTEKRIKAENCEQISNSIFGYKTMIPLYSFCFAFLAAVDYYVMVALAAAAVYAASVLYKRTPKIGWKFAVVIGAAFIAGFALSFIPQHI